MPQESRRRDVTLAVTAGLPVVLLGVGAAFVVSWSGRLPDPVATHWGAGGRPDGFGSLGAALLVPAVAAVLVVTGSTAAVLTIGRQEAVRRIAAGFSVGMTVYLAVLTLGSLAVQLDLTDAHLAPSISGWPMGAAIGAALVLGAAAGALVPGDPRQPATVPVPADAPRARVGGGGATWSRNVATPAIGWIIAIELVIAVATTVVTRLPWVLAVFVPVTAVLSVFAAVRVTVDHDGLTVRSWLGWPGSHVPLDEVLEARSTSVRALREFGGWGYRVDRTGRAGWVLRTGEALEVRRTGDRVLVVTVDDTGHAAALLNTLADRSRR